MMSSIAGLMEPSALHPQQAPNDTSGGNPAVASIGEAAESVGLTRALVSEFERLETDYNFLSPSFASESSRRASTCPIPPAAASDDRTGSLSIDSEASRRQSTAAEGSFAGSGMPQLSTNSFSVDTNDATVQQSFEHLRQLSQPDLLQYAMRLTTIVAAFMSHERTRREQRAHRQGGGVDTDSDKDGADTHGSTASEADLLTASIRSIRLPPVKNTNEVRKATDFEGNKTINEYSIIAELGRGAYGKVKLAVNNYTNDTCAVKIMKKSILKRGTGEQVVQREIAVMKKLRHKNVVPLYEVLDDPEAEKIYLVMKYIDNGTMVNVRSNDCTCNPLPLATATRYLRQLVSGLQYLHKHGVIHRDLKPDNILLETSGTVYLTDFGVSEIVSSESGGISGTEGTPVFLAPELLSGEPGTVAGPPVDVWALGVTFYLAVFGKAPFKGRTWNAIAKEVTTAEVTFPKDADPQWVDVLTRLLVKDPAKRMTLGKLKRHPLFAELNRELAADAVARNEPADDSVLDRIALNQAVEDDDDDDEDTGPERSPPGVLEVTDEEVRGSMRRLVTPIDEDSSVFASLSGTVKRRVSHFVKGLRGRLAERKFAAVAGDIVSDHEADEDDEIPDFTDDDPLPPPRAFATSPRSTAAAKERQQQPAKATATPRNVASGTGPRAVRAMAATNHGSSSTARVANGPHPPSGNAGPRNPRGGMTSTLEPLTSSGDPNDSPNTLYSTAGALPSPATARSVGVRRTSGADSSATPAKRKTPRKDDTSSATPKLPAIAAPGGRIRKR